MTSDPPPPNHHQPPATTAQPDERARLWVRAVEILTQAARLTRTQSDGTTEPDDFADFLATALAAVAGNVGTIERVTAGRPGSWEADLVHQLLCGMVGDDPDNLIAWRTEPVRVPLNVAQLVETYGPDAGPPVLTYDEAWQEISWPTDPDLTDEEWADAEYAAMETEHTLHHSYETAYADYAARFIDVIDEEARTITGLTTGWKVSVLRIPVEVVTETNPEEAWGPIENPTEWDSEPLVWDLWDRARRRLGLPRP